MEWVPNVDDFFCFPMFPLFFPTLEDPKKQGLPLWIEEEIQGLLRNSRWEILRQVCCVNFLSSILSRFCLIYLKLHALLRGGLHAAYNDFSVLHYYWSSHMQ